MQGKPERPNILPRCGGGRKKALMKWRVVHDRGAKFKLKSKKVEILPKGTCFSAIRLVGKWAEVIKDVGGIKHKGWICIRDKEGGRIAIQLNPNKTPSSRDTLKPQSGSQRSSEIQPSSSPGNSHESRDIREISRIGRRSNCNPSQIPRFLETRGRHSEIPARSSGSFGRAPRKRERSRGVRESHQASSSSRNGNRRIQATAGQTATTARTTVGQTATRIYTRKVNPKPPKTAGETSTPTRTTERRTTTTTRTSPGHIVTRKTAGKVSARTRTTAGQTATTTRTTVGHTATPNRTTAGRTEVRTRTTAGQGAGRSLKKRKLANPVSAPLRPRAKPLLGSEKKTLGSEAEILGSGKKILGSSKNTLGFGKKTLVSERKTLGSEKKTLGSEKILGSEDKSMGSKEALGSKDKAVGSEDMTLGSKDKTLGSEKGSASSKRGKCRVREIKALPVFCPLKRRKESNSPSLSKPSSRVATKKRDIKSLSVFRPAERDIISLISDEESEEIQQIPKAQESQEAMSDSGEIKVFSGDNIKVIPEEDSKSGEIKAFSGDNIKVIPEEKVFSGDNIKVIPEEDSKRVDDPGHFKGNERNYTEDNKSEMSGFEGDRQVRQDIPCQISQERIGVESKNVESKNLTNCDEISVALERAREILGKEDFKIFRLIVNAGWDDKQAAYAIQKFEFENQEKQRSFSLILKQAREEHRVVAERLFQKLEELMYPQKMPKCEFYRSGYWNSARLRDDLKFFSGLCRKCT
ncbi:hypothetical protein AAMO2058_000481700 [Amorphochlora amoebiformis]